MGHTALQEQFGDAFDSGATTDNVVIPLPYGPGCARFIVSRPTGATPDTVLPDARLCEVGTVYTVINAGDSASNLMTNTFSAIVQALAVGQAYEVTLLSNATQAGTWTSRAMGAATISSGITNTAEVYEFELDGGFDVNVYDECVARFGYDGTSPARVTVYIKEDAVIGSTDTSEYGPGALSSGSGWASGSILRVWVRPGGKIVGRGGDGGRGGSASLLAGDGGRGGAAFDTSITTYIVNFGSILGGGGGGGGRAYSAPVGGPGGGGGAGYEPSRGGTGGASATPSQIPGQDGFPGGLDGPGLGGLTPFLTSAGAGGAHGAAGTASGGLGGAAGNATVAFLPATITKVVAGTIAGAEVSV